MLQVRPNSKCILEGKENERLRLEKYRDELMQLFKEMKNCRHW